MMLKLLIADDHSQITKILSEFAKKEGYVPIIAQDGQEALDLYYQEKPDVVLLDVMMPKLSGFDVCRKIRQTSHVPILMITARSEDYDKIMGLDLGADDYILKPFSGTEVMARIRAVMRRVYPETTHKKISTDNLSIDLQTYETFLGQTAILLTKKEFEILSILLENKGQVFSRTHLLNLLWGEDYEGEERTVDSHIKRLRAKLDQGEHPTWQIRTIWGVGYKFEEMEHET